MNSAEFELRVFYTFLNILRAICSGHGYPTQRAAKTSCPCLVRPLRRGWVLALGGLSAGASVSRGPQCQTLFLAGASVSDFVFGFTADPGHDLFEIIRKSRVASQARVDAARQVGDTVGPSEAEHGSQFMQRDLAVLAAEPGGGRSSDVRIAATRQSRTDQAEVITNRLEDGLRISCGQLTSTRKRWIRQDRPGQLPQPSDEPLRAQHPATEGRAERRGRRTPQTCLHEAPVGTR